MTIKFRKEYKLDILYKINLIKRDKGWGIGVEGITEKMCSQYASIKIGGDGDRGQWQPGGSRHQVG
jgi:hypothetical protein